MLSWSIRSHITDPEKRTPAREVETYLKKALEEIDPGRLDSWLKILAKKWRRDWWICWIMEAWIFENGQQQFGDLRMSR